MHATAILGHGGVLGECLMQESDDKIFASWNCMGRMGQNAHFPHGCLPVNFSYVSFFICIAGGSSFFVGAICWWATKLQVEA